MENYDSQRVRFAVFDWLNSLVFKYPDKVIPSMVLANDCVVGGERVVLSGQQGIAVSYFYKIPYRQYL